MRFNNRYKTPAERAETKKRNEAQKQKLTEAQERLRDVIQKVEDAFQPESDRLYASVIKRWTDARAVVQDHKGEEASLYNKITGGQHGMDYGTRMHIFKGQPGYEAYKVESEARSLRSEKWHSSLEYRMLYRDLWKNDTAFKTISEREAAMIVEAEKFKLRQAVVKKLMHLKTVEVKHHYIKEGQQGFEGYFTLDTNEGLLIFECFSIWVWGVVVESHARYLSYLKTPERSKAGERL